jgi:diguanylate cyclase (GGDEF)-like protein
VLTALVSFLRPRVRRGDLIARWGGEEFAVVLPGASTRVALKKTRAILRELAITDWTIDTGRAIRFTISAGVTAWKSDDEPVTITARADRALYKAKHAGRNRAERG